MLDRWKRRTRFAQALQAYYDTPDGSFVINELMKRCGLLTTSVDPDPLAMAFAEGRRSVALDMLNELRFSTADAQRLSEEREFSDLHRGMTP